MRQIIIDLGTYQFLGVRIPLRFYGYGLMLVLGFFTAILLAKWRARRSGESPDVISSCGMLALAGGVVGARAAYIVENWGTFTAGGQNVLFGMLNMTSGGLIYYGGLVLAIVLVLAYLRVKRLPIRRYLDILAVSAMIGLAFGRVGCLLNGCCYGKGVDEGWALGMRFPMFSQPLVKLNGRDNPFSAGTDGPTPPYAHQLAAGVVHPDDRLVNLKAPPPPSLHPPRYLHGRLSRDQLATMFAEESQVRARFAALAGLDGRLSEDRWQQGLREGGLLAGSESWDEAIYYDADQDGRLDFAEFTAYLMVRRGRLVAKFDLDRDGRLSDWERQAANEYLQADLFQLAASSWSVPVKPAQVLGILNGLVLAGILAAFHRLRNREGQVFALLVVLYPVTRWLLERIRDQEHPWGAWTHNQYTSVAMVVAGVVMWWALRRLPASSGPTWAERRALAEGAAAPAYGEKRTSKSGSTPGRRKEPDR